MTRETAIRKTEQTRAAVMLALNLLISIVVSLLPDWYDKFTKQSAATFKLPDQVLLGVTVFAAFTLVEALWQLSRDLDEKHAGLEIAHLDGTADMMLHNIRAHHLELAVRSRHGAKDFFVAYFHDALMALQARIRDAAKKGEICCEGEHVNLKESLVEALLSSATLSLKYTWSIGPNDPLFDFYPWHSYFKTTCELAAAGKIAALEVLLVFESDAARQRQDVQKLLEIYAQLPNCQCYVIDLRQYQQVVDSVHPQQSCIDFGMYGENLLYLGLDYEHPHHKSIFTSDAKALHDYQKIWQRSLDDAEAVPTIKTSKGGFLDLKPLFSICQKIQL